MLVSLCNVPSWFLSLHSGEVNGNHLWNVDDLVLFLYYWKQTPNCKTCTMTVQGDTVLKAQEKNKESNLFGPNWPP